MKIITFVVGKQAKACLSHPWYRETKKRATYHKPHVPTIIKQISIIPNKNNQLPINH